MSTEEVSPALPERLAAATIPAVGKSLDVMELTAEERALLDSAFEHARRGDTAPLGFLVQQGIPVNLTNAAGDTLLILAAYHDHPATVQMLLTHGADHHRVNDRGQTALGAAVFRRSAQSVLALLGAGADPDHGPRSAHQIATFFDLNDMTALLDTTTHPRRTD